MFGALNHQVSKLDQLEIVQEFHACHPSQLTQLFLIYIQSVQIRFDSEHVGVTVHHHQPPPQPHPLLFDVVFATQELLLSV
jgi:hypothetical protein